MNSHLPFRLQQSPTVLDRIANVDLLAAEIDVIWGPGRRPHEAPPSVVIGDAGNSMIIMVRDDVEADVAAAVRTTAVDNRLPQLARDIQDVLQRSLGPLEATVGPSYDCSAPVPQPDPSIGRLVRSDDADDSIKLATPPTWDDAEWAELLTGRLGPWAAVADDERVLSLCHSARLAAGGVEAGTWTHADARGRGLAAAATAAWAEICRPLPGHIFYSTDAYNLSSQRVAARLALPPIGQLWKFRPADEGDGPEGARLSLLLRA